MIPGSIDDIYSINAGVRQRFKDALKGISSDKYDSVPENGGWSIARIVEHVAIVSEGASRFCSHLVAKAKTDGKPAGDLPVTAEFLKNLLGAKGTKFEAPEVALPSGTMNVEDSLARLDASTLALTTLAADMAAYDITAHKFPHPYFGPLNAAEWLYLLGGHESRHTDQIEAVAASL